MEFNSKDYAHYWHKRLAKEHAAIKETCENSDLIEWKVLKTLTNGLPWAYEITYFVRSIVRIEADQTPIFGDVHKVVVEFPKGYPSKPPKLFCITDVWHPNIKTDNPGKGRICVDSKAIMASINIDYCLVQIFELLSWKIYLGDDNQPPYPESLKAAKWVREFAEPMGIISLEKGICTDERPFFRNSSRTSKEMVDDFEIIDDENWKQNSTDIITQVPETSNDDEVFEID